MKYWVLLFSVTAFAGHTSTRQKCMDASRASAEDTIEVCELALQNTVNDPNEQSVIYITKAEYLIRKSRFTAAEKVLDSAFNANPAMLQNGIYRLNWLRIKGSVYSQQEEYVDALPYFKQALDVALILQNQGLIANGYNDLGAINLSLERYETALEWLKLSMEIHLQTDNAYRLALTYANIAEIYRAQNNHTLALDYFEKSLSSHLLNLEENTDKSNFYKPYIAHVYRDLGTTLIDLNQLGRAYEYLQKASVIYRELNLSGQQIDVLSTLTKLHLKQQQFSDALQVIDEALALEEKLGLKKLSLRKQLVIAQFESGLNTAAKQSALAGLELSRAKQSNADEAFFLEKLAQVFEQAGDTASALKYFKAFQATNALSLAQQFNQSMVKLQKDIQDIEQKSQIDALKLAQAEQKLELTSQRWMLVSVLVVLATSLIGLLWLWRKKTSQHHQLKIDQRGHLAALQNMTTNQDELAQLFKGLKTPLVCFDLSGKVIYTQETAALELEPPNNIRAQSPSTWLLFSENLKDDETLPDLHQHHLNWKTTTSETGLTVWLHQMAGVDDVFVCLLFNDNHQTQALLEAQMINEYDQLMSLMHNSWTQRSNMPVHEVIHNKPLLQSLKALQPKHTLTPINDESLKELMHDLLHECIQAWQSATDSDKLELAEKSGLWSVSIDDGRLRTRTLNRYLTLESIPKHPRWRQVIKTAHYVLSTCELSPHSRHTLNQKTNHFVQQLKQSNKQHPKMSA